MTSLKKNEQLLPVLALLLVQLIFGFNFAATKVILVEYPPVLWGGIRLMIAAILMFICSFFIVPKTQRRTDWKFLGPCFLYGMIGIAANQAFFMLGLKYTTTTNAAILNSLTPLFTLLFAIVAGSEKFTRSRGFKSIFLLNSPTLCGQSYPHNFYYGMIISAVVQLYISNFVLLALF